MAEKVTQEKILDWKPPLYAAAITVFLLVSLIVYSAYWDVLFVLFLAPIICIAFLVLLVAAVIRKRKRQFLALLSTLAVVVGVSAPVLMRGQVIRDHVRWLIWSRSLKAQVMAQPPPVSGELRHVEWEATGFAGVANNTAYVVFDPTDSLLVQHPSGEFAGVPCRVLSVRWLEHQWYSVRFYTDEEWGDCPATRTSGG
jgi:hypothetical protein